MRGRLSNFLLPFLLAAFPGGAPAQGQEEWPSEAEFLGLPKDWRPQFRFLLGSHVPTSGVARPNFTFSGSGPDATQAASAFRPGTLVLVQVGGLGPAAELGAFVEFLHRRQKAFLRGLPDLGFLNSSGVFFSPTMGRPFSLGEEWTLRPFLQFGAGAIWSTLEASDPNLWPAPPPGLRREFKGVRSLGWKAGGGMDLHWSRTSGIVLSGQYLGHSPSLLAVDQAGSELGRVEFDSSAWSWMIGVVFSY